MIIDRIQLAGRDAYFQAPNNPGTVNLAPAAQLAVPVTVRTAPLKKGQQVEISGLQLLIEGDDLRPMFQFQLDANGKPAPLFRISVMKEMFSGLFADPFRHRVYNVAGALDFNEGTLSNGRILEVEGIPTICSVGKEECKWVSRIYVLAEPISIDSVAWELASSKLTAPDSFSYRIDVDCFDASNNPVGTISTGANLIKADKPRFVEQQLDGVASFQVTFRAIVNQDSFVTERHLPTFNEKTGRPLLRAINVLEMLDNSVGSARCVYDIHSLTELKSLCSDFQLFEAPGPEIKRLTSTLNLIAVLVNSPNQVITNNDIYHANSRFEFVELELMQDVFTRFDAKRNGEILVRTNG